MADGRGRLRRRVPGLGVEPRGRPGVAPGFDREAARLHVCSEHAGVTAEGVDQADPSPRSRALPTPRGDGHWVFSLRTGEARPRWKGGVGAWDEGGWSFEAGGRGWAIPLPQINVSPASGQGGADETIKRLNRDAV